MRERAEAALKMVRIMDTLSTYDQSSIAFDMYRAYFHPELHGQGVHKESTKQGQLGSTSAEGSHNSSVVSSSPKDQLLRQEARNVLQFLNEKTGKNYRYVEPNLSLIRNCLKSGATSDDIRGVIARKLREWKGTDFEKYLRPITLFNPKKFEAYIGEQGT